jgi:anti-anti-sigma factor
LDITREELEFSNFFARLLYDKTSHIFILILSGSMDKTPMMKVQEHVSSIISDEKFDFIVDISHATYVSSTGLGFLMYLLKKRKDIIFISCPPEIILKPFKLLEMDELFQFYYNPEELKMRASIPDDIIQIIKDETFRIEDYPYKKRWLNILSEFFNTEEELKKEILKMTPYIKRANNHNTITLPSEEKYAFIVYSFLHRVFFEVAKINQEEIDEILIELIAKELMTNAVKHGYDYNKDGVVEVNYEINDERLLLHFIDFGKGFSPSKDSDDHFPSTGLHLLQKIFDKIDIENAPKKDIDGLVLGKGTMVKMVKYIKPIHERKSIGDY